MATKVRGITIELGADTSGIQSALKTVNSSLKSTSTQLKDVNNLLKLDPSNTELLAQKMNLLKSGIETTKSKMETLAQAEESLKAEMEAAGGGSDEQKQQLAALEREMIACQQEGSKYESELSELEEGHNDVADSADKAKSSESKFGDVLKTVGQAAAAAAAAVTAAAVELGTAVVESYAEYEQLVGGVETLFGESAATVEAYAENAYQTAGMSANAYMETVTGFSASLIQSLGGDTAAAAEMANLAITDMSDNANKMGTDMESIQNAYQGFAKQNYTMLDNLKLGYGGTKEEMERLIDDANELAIAQGEAGDLTIDSYSDVIEAIHLVQDEMGITGTTAEEAEKTISGSISTLEASWDNFLTGLGDSDADMEELANKLITAFSNVMTNITPIVENIVSALPIAVQAIAEALPTIIPAVLDAVKTLIMALVENMDVLLESVLSIIDTLIDMIIECLPEILPKLVTFVLELITGLAGAIIENVGPILLAVGECLLKILDAIGTWFLELVGLNDEEGDGIWDDVAEWFLGILDDIGTWLSNIWTDISTWFTNLLTDIGTWFSNIWTDISTWFTDLLTDIGTWVDDIWTDIDTWFTDLVTDVGTWIQGIWDKIADFFGDAWELGEDLVKGLWDGISGAADWLWTKISGWIGGIWSGIKDFFGIHSPSKQMAWIGEMLDEGLGQGIEDNEDVAVGAANSMVKGINNAMNGLTDGSVTATVSSVNGLDNLNAQLGLNFDSLGSTLASILKLLDNGQKIYLDGDKLVGYTVKPMNVALGKLSVMEARA